MTQIRFFTDEDIYGSTASALRRAGFDAVSTPETGRRGESDESQLVWASNESRTIVSFNVAHFAQLHARWMAQQQEHAGIVVSSQRSVGDLINRLLRLAKGLTAESMRNRLEFLNDW